MTFVQIFRSDGFWRNVRAMILKEVLQLRRDHVTLATMITVPLMQLILFGYAINTTPHDLPTAVLLQETSDVGRSILAALENTKYFKITYWVVISTVIRVDCPSCMAYCLSYLSFSLFNYLLLGLPKKVL